MPLNKESKPKLKPYIVTSSSCHLLHNIFDVTVFIFTNGIIGIVEKCL